MDLQKTAMGSIISQNYSANVFPQLAKFTSTGAMKTGCQPDFYQPPHWFNPNWNSLGNMPGSMSGQLLKGQMSHMEPFSSVGFCIVGGFVGGNGTISDANFNASPSQLWNLTEIHVNMCESPQSSTPPVKVDTSSPKMSFSEVLKNCDIKSNVSTSGLSYAEVAKLPAPINKKLEKPAPCKAVHPAKESTFRKTAPKSHFTTNKFRRDSTERFRNKSDRINIPKPHPVHNPHSEVYRRKSRKRRDSPTCKRELGTKKNHPKLDMDGSLWAEQNVTSWQDGVSRAECKAERSASVSSESECSPEVRDSLLCPRVRSLSECSATSLDSDDSFIVFECGDDATFSDGSSSDGSSSDEQDEIEGDLCELFPCGCGTSLRDVNEKWNRSETGCCSDTRNSPQDCSVSDGCSCPQPTSKKKVRFARGDGLVRKKTLVVWEAAHRLARQGPWEAMARDRDRFSNRIHAIAPLLSAVLRPDHRAAVYHRRFS